MLSKDKIMELVPVTSGVVIAGSGAFSLSTIINITLLALLLLQFGYVLWKWRRDWLRHKRARARIRAHLNRDSGNPVPCEGSTNASRRLSERRGEDFNA